MKRCEIAGLLMAVVLAGTWLGPARAESQIAGVSIGQPPRVLMEAESYRSPTGMITAPLTYEPQMGAVTAGWGALPPYAKAVTPQTLGEGQVQWDYERGQIALGFVFSGQGPDAHISDIIVSLWDDEKARAPFIRTEKGITLGDSFREVLLRYGYPPLIQTLRVSAAAGTGRAATRMALPPGGRAAAGPTRLPPVAVPVGRGETSAPVGLGHEIFTKNCILSYPGITFTLFDMKVIRIHIYEETEQVPSALAAPRAPTQAEQEEEDPYAGNSY